MIGLVRKSPPFLKLLWLFRAEPCMLLPYFCPRIFMPTGAMIQVDICFHFAPRSVNYFHVWQRPLGQSGACDQLVNSFLGLIRHLCSRQPSAESFCFSAKPRLLPPCWLGYPLTPTMEHKHALCAESGEVKPTQSEVPLAATMPNFQLLMKEDKLPTLEVDGEQDLYVA